MKRFTGTGWMTFAVVSLCFFACVTINIYFPAERVESVATEIVDDVRGRESRDSDEQEEQKESLLNAIKHFCVPASAWAQEATEISNATIRALKKQMKDRYTLMKPYYEREALVEQDDGYVAISEKADLGLKDKRDLKAMVAAENKNRRKLYEEVAKALSIELSQVDRIAVIFAREWQKQ